MKTVKPMKVGVLARPTSVGGRFYLAVGAMLYVPMPPAEGLLTEPSLWKMAAAELADGVLDLGVPKSRGEWLVAGRACAPNGAPAAAVRVRVKVGNGREKVLRVTGDRYWEPLSGAVSAVQPFLEMPITWANAYGGPDYKQNPLGKGHRPVRQGVGDVHWLPNVEDPDRPVRSPRDYPPPAGFAAYDIAWPQRSGRAGTYDDKWLKTLFPGPAADFDWTVYNAAPPDQWVDGFFQGDETYVLEGLHPARAVIEGRLPGLRARSFVTLKAEGEERFVEVPLRLETLHFVPHRERLVMIFRGTVEVQEDDASDVLHLLLAAERLDAPRDVAHYADVLRRRLDPEKGALEALKESELLPAGSEVRPPEVALEDRDDTTALLRTEGLLQKNMARRYAREAEAMKARLREAGIDPDTTFEPQVFEVPPETLPDLENIPELVERQMAEAEEKEREIHRRREAMELEARATCEAAGVDYDALMAKAGQKTSGPPRRSSRMMIEELRRAATEANLGRPVPEIEARVADPQFLAQLDESDAQRMEMYRLSAHMGDGADALFGDEAAAVRARVEATQPRAFRGADLTGADLSGMDLRDADFTEALLESASFAGSDLAGARFERAVVARADFSGAKAPGAVFRGANLGAATLFRADLTGADLSNATLTRADLSEATLAGVKFVGVTVHDVRLAGADLRDADLTDVLLHESDLTGARFAGAELGGATFLKVRGKGVSFASARLARASFVEAHLDDADFTGAHAENLRVVMETRLPRARFVEAVLDGASMRDTAFPEADFSKARAKSADFSGCDLTGARFYRAVAREARFSRANLTDAVLLSLDAMDAIFQSADITRADFTGANLFAADFGRVKGKSRSMTDAITGRLQMYPRRPE